MTDWLPESYKAPSFANPQEPIVTNEQQQQVNTKQFFIDFQKVATIVAASDFCRQRFNALAHEGFKHYKVAPKIESGELTGFDVIVY